MDRRSFLSLLASIPFVRHFVAGAPDLPKPTDRAAAIREQERVWAAGAMPDYAALRALSEQVEPDGVTEYADECCARGVPVIVRCTDDLGEALIGFTADGRVWTLRRPPGFKIPTFSASWEA